MLLGFKAGYSLKAVLTNRKLPNGFSSGLNMKVNLRLGNLILVLDGMSAKA